VVVAYDSVPPGNSQRRVDSTEKFDGLDTGGSDGAVIGKPIDVPLKALQLMAQCFVLLGPSRRRIGCASVDDGGPAGRVHVGEV
jgi:hypothetical protein